MEWNLKGCAQFELILHTFVQIITHMHNASNIPLIVNTLNTMSTMSITKRGILSITMNTPNPNSALLVPFSFDDTANME